MSNFSFPHDFFPIRGTFSNFIIILVVFCKLFGIGAVQNLSFGNGLMEALKYGNLFHTTTLLRWLKAVNLLSLKNQTFTKHIVTILYQTTKLKEVERNCQRQSII